MTKTFIEILQQTNEQLTEKDKQKYENPKYNIKVSGFDISYIENPNFLKVSFEKETNTTTLNLVPDFVRKTFFNTLKKEFKNIDETETYAQIQTNALYRAFNFIVVDFLRNNNHLFL